MRLNNASANTKKSVELNNFLGVDFSSAPTNVSTKRASFAKNLVSENGVNQKRPGWEEIYAFFQDYFWGKDSTINGIFINKFERNGFIDEVMLVQQADKFYRIIKDEDNNTYNAINIPITKQLSDYSLKTEFEPFENTTDWSFLSQGFMSNNRLYILGGGEYLVLSIDENYKSFEEQEKVFNDDLGKWEYIDKIYNKNDSVEFNGFAYTCLVDGVNAIENKPSGKNFSTKYWGFRGDIYRLDTVIDNKYTYTPTTTIGIMPKESGDTSRSSLDKINLLNAFRINKLRGVGSDVEPSTVFVDTADTVAQIGKEYYISNGNETFTLAENVSDLGDTLLKSNGYYEERQAYTFQLDSEMILKGSLFKVEIESKYGNYNKLYHNISNRFGKKLGKSFDRFLYDGQGNQHGYIDIEKGILYIFDSINIEPPNGVQDNITVTYSPYEVDETITHCAFGCRFGYQGRDTLFLSGNPKYPNKDFYSYTVKEDFTYFPADNIETFGSPSTSVKAYLHISDGTLAVLKESSRTEPSIYYRGVSYNTNELGVTTIQYPVKAGASGEGAINAYTCGNLQGDNLFVSENGIFGLTLSENVVVNERYAKERDKFIHAKVIKHNLANAVATVYQGKYLLAVDGVCYVMDSRFKSTSQEDADDTFSYECWFWDNMPIHCFCVYNNELYFGTKDGKFCKFKKDSYTDDKIIDLGVGYFESSDSGIVTISKELRKYIQVGQCITIRGWGELPEFFTEEVDYIGTIQEIDGYHLQIPCETGNADVLYKFRIGDYIGIKIQIGDGFTSFPGRIYDIANNSLYIETEYGYHNIVGKTITKIFRNNIINKKYYVSEIFDDNSFKLCNQHGEVLNVYSEYNYYFETTYNESIVATWQSAVLDLGLYDYSKNLDSLSVVLSPDYHGKVRFGYETKKVTLDLMAKQIKSAETEQSHHYFDFDNIDFDNFTFETAFATSYTKRIRERNINYIMFKAVMDDEQNSALMSIKVDYTIYKKNRGVR